jgi:hypothetical protein
MRPVETRKNGPQLLSNRFPRIFKGMEVHFTPEQEAQIFQAARATGVVAENLVRAAALLFAEDACFHAAVLEAMAFADRGEFIEEDEMDARFEEMLRS